MYCERRYGPLIRHDLLDIFFFFLFFFRGSSRLKMKRSRRHFFSDSQKI